MKNLNVVVMSVLLLCLLAGCSEDNSMSAWAWGDSGAIGARVGTKVTENNEAGLSMVWWPDDSEPRVLGLYGVHHFPDPVEFRNPLMLDFLPETLEARAYIGGKLDVNLDTDDTSIGPVAGVIFEDILFIEYRFQSFSQNTNSVSSEVLLGLRIEF